MTLSVGVRAARFLTQSPGRTALLGAGIGGAAGAASAEEGDRFGGAFRGARAGAVAGGLGGLGGRAFRDVKLMSAAQGKTLSNTEAAVGAAKRLGRQASNFGRRQFYGVTGIGDPDKIRMAGNATSGRQARMLELRAADDIKHAPSAEAAKRIREQANSAIEAERKSGRNSQMLQDAGVTSVRGLAKGLMNKDTRGTAFKAMGKAMAYGPGGLGMSVGLPTAMAIPGLMKGDESAQGGKSMGQKVLGLGANLATGAAFGGMPIIPQMALGTAADVGVNRAMAKRPSQQQVSYAGAPYSSVG